MLNHRGSWLAKVLLGSLVLSSLFARANDLNRDLERKYLHKVFVLKHFYSGRTLSFDSSGHPSNENTEGDWTEDGIIEIRKIRISHQKLEIQANRVLAFATRPAILGLAPVDFLLQIEIELGSASDATQVDSVLSQVFLTQRDRFPEFVPDYWKPCVKNGLSGVDDSKLRGCHFSKELAVLLGSKSYAPGDPALRVDEPADVASAIKVDAEGKLQPVRNGVSPPRPIQKNYPDFSRSARMEHLEGTITLCLVVNAEGLPTHIRVLQPIGAGLEAQAFRSLQAWKFDPARKNGEPVPVEIAVEFDFHFE